MMSRLFYVALFFMALWSSVWGGDTLSELRQKRQVDCGQLAESQEVFAPAILSQLDKLPTYGNFVTLNSVFVQADIATQVAIAKNSQYLYLNFLLDEPEMKNVRKQKNPRMWKNDVMEFFWWRPHQKNTCWHFAFDTTGKRYFSRDVAVTEMPGTHKSKLLNADAIKVKIKFDSRRWQLIAAIPLKLFPGGVVANSQVNFGRQRQSTGEIFCFTNTSIYRNYDNAARLSIGRATQALRMEQKYHLALQRFQNERVKMMQNLKKIVYQHPYAFAAAPQVPGYRALNQIYRQNLGWGWLNYEGIKVENYQDYEKKQPRLYRKIKQNAVSALANNILTAQVPNKNGRIAHVFRVDLPDGRYKVHLLMGVVRHEKTPHRREFDVFAQGKFIQHFDIGNLGYTRYDFPVEVSGGKLLLEFRGNAVLPENRRSYPLSQNERAKFYVPGWLINSIVITPRSDASRAAQQLGIDELEITHCPVAELGKYEFKKFGDPDNLKYSAADQKRGFVLFARPWGTHLYPESRPQSGELVKKLKIQAVPGEFIALNFGLLPLRNLEQVQIELQNLSDLTIYETRYVSWHLGGGKYGMVPMFNDFYNLVDHDMFQGVNRWIWLTGHLSPQLTPGKHCGKVKITCSGQTTLLPVEIEILPFKVSPTDFAFGGFNPLGYNRPGAIWEDKLAASCALYGLHAQVFYVNPFVGEKSWKILEQRLKIYQKYGVKGPFFVYVSLLDQVDRGLKKMTAQRIPDAVFDVMVNAARRLEKMHREQGYPELIFIAMDEAHCHSENYWSEQVRLYRFIKKSCPLLRLASTESDRSIQRLGTVLDCPIAFEVDDFNAYSHNTIFTYTNQYLLAVNDMNSGRFQCGWFPAVTRVKGVIPWMVYQGIGESGLRKGALWTMFQQRSVGSYHYAPKLCVLAGTVGMWDLYYFRKLESMIKKSLQSRNPQRIKKAQEAAELVQEIRQAIKPSVKYYYQNGYWAPEVFNRLREIVTEQIIKLNALEK